ncbi:SLC13 family permease [Alteromonas sp. ASW11-19]|uniref:SLC13 family permease n=1 Tax=Alteromonas salexigens TaxID=2982530 RepID=A0ABT2VKR9_9ALTE|nr:SLC13 family permease [Alteromonas salexigens]MCU7553895.1 SLC13 family permease [Alteromonas salexigens]
MDKVRPRYVWLAVVVAVLTGGVMMALGLPPGIILTAAITVLVAVCWVTEAMPLAVTSLIPFVAFPMAGVLTYQQAAAALGNPVILLLMGAFMLSKALEKSGVHQRLAIYLLRLTGTRSARRLVLGFMLTAAVLSMGVSNTATALMLLPIALAVIAPLESHALATAILLGIAYGASVGGIGSPIGTPPNVIFMSMYEQATGNTISFLEWMKTGLWVVVIAIPLMALWLTRGLSTLPVLSLPELTRWRPAERRVLWVFTAIALAWVFRPYWTAWLGMPFIGDSSIALAGVILMCLIPNGEATGSGRLLDWKTAEQIPWGLLLVFAGGICLATAFTASGFSQRLGEALGGVGDLPVILLVLVLCVAVSFLTEVTSNTATATLLMPILASVAVAIDIDPALLMMPAAMSASCAFMMPVATPTNAIVYSSGKLAIADMAREGLILNLLLAVIITGVVTMTR